MYKLKRTNLGETPTDDPSGTPSTSQCSKLNFQGCNSEEAQIGPFPDMSNVARHSTKFKNNQKLHLLCLYTYLIIFYY